MVNPRMTCPADPVESNPQAEGFDLLNVANILAELSNRYRQQRCITQCDRHDVTDDEG